LNVLSLCSGIAGLDLGIKAAFPQAKVIGYVEREPYCQRVLLARMADGLIDSAPIWGDLFEFDGKPWRGSVDAVAGGFPCQDISNAGRREGIQAGNRSGLWFEFARIIGEVRPGYVFVENVAALLNRGLDIVLGSLAEMGFDAEWGIVSAADAGAPHLRKRVFLLAHSGGERLEGHCCPRRWPGAARRGSGAVMGDAEQQGSQGSAGGWMQGEGRAPGIAACGREALPLFPPGPGDRDAWGAVLKHAPALEPAVCRVADGPSARVDRLKALGNAVVPAQAGLAFRLLAERI
jgi:DNA (cytosine-5)-methyltransferase 1